MERFDKWHIPTWQSRPIELHLFSTAHHRSCRVHTTKYKLASKHQNTALKYMARDLPSVASNFPKVRVGPKSTSSLDLIKVWENDQQEGILERRLALQQSTGRFAEKSRRGAPTAQSQCRLSEC
jgi:hypothetical protein